MSYFLNKITCLNCNHEYKDHDLDSEGLYKNGCFSCHTKHHCEWNMTMDDKIVIYQNKNCSKCSKPRVFDILNWDNLKNLGFSKKEFLEKMNSDSLTCKCGGIIEDLRIKVKALEAITNPTSAQQKELQETKTELANLSGSSPTDQNSQDPKQSWTPYIIGGVFILFLGIGAIIYFCTRSTKNKHYDM